MKGLGPEMEALLRKGLASAGVDQAGGQKLRELFLRAESAAPDRHRVAPALASLKREKAGFRPPRFVRWAPVPAFAALAVLVYFIAGRSVSFDAPVGALTVSSGNVIIHRGTDHRPSGKGAPLRKGDRVTTGKGSRAEVTVKGLCRILLLEGGEIRFSGSAADPGAELARGTAVMHAWGIRKGDVLTFGAPGSRSIVKGTVFSVSVGEDGIERYTVYEGAVKVERKVPAGVNPAVSAILRKNFRDNAVMVLENQHCLVPALKDAGLPVLKAKDIIDRTGQISLVEGADPFEGLGEFMAGRTGGAPASVQVKVELDPPGAALFIDGRQRRPLAGGVLVTPGRHQVAVRADGHDEWRGEVDAARDVSLSVRLKPRADVYASAGYEHILEDGSGAKIGLSRNGAIDGLSSGRVAWRVSAGGALASWPVIRGGSVYVHTTAGDLMALSAARGAVLWRVSLPVTAGSKSHLFAADDGLYAVAESGWLVKLSHAGSVSWKLDLAGEPAAAPVTDRDMVFVARADGRLLGIDKRKGYLIMNSPMKEVPLQMTMHGGRIFAVTLTGRTWSYDCRTGDYAWLPGRLKGAVTGSFSEAGGYLFTTSAGELVMMGVDGKPRWRFDAGRPFRGSPARDNESLYVLNGSTLHVLDRNTGEVKWSLVIEEPPTGRITLTDDRVFIETAGRKEVVLKK